MATATALAVTLTGCTAPAPEPEATAGASSDLVEVGGDFGERPRVDFPTPVAPETTQCTEVIDGDGERLVEGQQALVGLAVYNGATGEDIQVIGFDDEDPVPVLLGANTLPGLSKGLSCASEGSRVVVVVPPADAFGEEGNASLGIGAEDSLVVVFDVHEAFLARANGTPQVTRDGFPAVVTAPDGRPGITVPDEEPFETTEVEVLKQGHGEEVESGDQVLVHYTGVGWEDGTVLDSTWQQGGPTTIVVGEDAAAQGSPAFAESLEGLTVGSQVGIAVPADEAGNPAAFYVVDILGVV
jgi:peptidylprolyl isomerase